MENNTQPPVTIPTPPQMPVEPPISSNKPNLLVISLVVVEVVTLLVAGYFGYQFMQLKKQLAEPQSTSSPTSNLVLPSATPLSNETSSWKTYTDPNGTYIFKYPTNYALGHYATDNSPLLLNNRIDWGITQHPSGSCMGDCPIVTSTKNTTINSYSATLYEGWVGSIGGETPQSYIKYEIKDPLHITPEENSYFVMTLWELDRNSDAQKNYSQERKIGVISEADKAIFNQIISTLKFTQ